MPVRAQALTMHYFATDADGPKTGDVGNHTLKVIEDGVVGAVAASPAEVDATNAPGIYRVAISAAENTADVVTLCGKSSTSGVTISPSTWTNIANVAAVNGSTTAAVAQGAGAGTMVIGELIAGSSTGVLKGTGSLSTTDDFYNNRFLIFTSGTLSGQGRRINDYLGSAKTFYVDEGYTSAPSSGDDFIIV